MKTTLCLLTFALLSLASARSVTDDLGRTVQIPDAPKRVAALSPFLVESLYAVGVTPVARPSSATYPAEATKVPEVGLSYTPNLERLAATNPDLVLVSGITQAQLIPAIEKLGFPVVAINSDNLNDVYKNLQRLGAWTGREAQARAAEKNVRVAVASARGAAPTRPLNVFTLIGSPKGFLGAKKESFTGSLITALGARNVASGEDDKRYRGFAPYSMERLLKADPDVIVLIKPTSNPTQAGNVLKEFSADPLWKNLKAVKNGRVYELEPDVVLSSPGPRAALALKELAALLYGKK